jgi:hypothetical protein
LISYLSKYKPEFYDKLMAFPEEYNKKIFSELKTRIKYFSEYNNYTSFFYEDSKIPEKDIIINEKMKIVDIDMVKKSLNISLDILKDK